MPFDEEDTDLQEQPKRIGLKKVSSQKSIFDKMAKKLSPNIDEVARGVEKKKLTYKEIAADLSLQFKKAMSDKTLPENKNVFQIEAEQEMLSKMVKLAVDVNTDENEDEGMGSLMWVILLLKTNLNLRSQINLLEYELARQKNVVNKLEKMSEEILKQLPALDKDKKDG